MRRREAFVSSLILAACLPGCAARSRTTPAPSAAMAAGEASEAPVVREIVLDGVAAFDEATVSRAIFIKPGGRLRRGAETAASDLETRYKLKGYPAARVTAAFDAATGRLTLRADEGRLKEVAIEGLEGRAAERAKEILALPLEAPVQEKELRTALHRLADVSGGALRSGEPSYTVESLPEGVRLHVHVIRRRYRLVLRPQGPDLSPFRNRVEGTAPGASAELLLPDPVSFHDTSVYARAAYGFTSESLRFALGARRPFGPGGKLVLGYEFHDLTDTDDHFRRQLVEAPAARSLAFSIFEDYFRRRGHEAYAFFRATSRLHFGINARSDTHLGLPVVADDSLFFFRRAPRPNPVTAPGLVRSILLTVRGAARGSLFPNDAAERESFLVRSPYGQPFEAEQGARVESTFEIAGGSLGGDSGFRRLLTHARAHRSLSTRLGVNGRLLLGMTGGQPPPERQFALGGQGTLRGYAAKEFPGANIALATVEWSYQPPARWPTPLAFYDGGVAWTSGTDGRGWRDDVGVGLEWPGHRQFVRIDVGFALKPEAGRDRARVHALLRLPF